ncbi:hypothetical protein FB388_3075 [Pseudonocardia cypriaca]|uniref:Uncharacterized protein n=1 Tax=Pseudonocardia cypriaca TaxID=882449 RepID=A0A543GHX9_9PSEU|nr:hypothetical protein FB388_3075 [Pseudonocardia cypriaca]
MGIEAPYTGGNVRVVPMRTRGLLPQAARVLSAGGPSVTALRGRA